ncbi:bifunctional 5,10-methylenetetrahydrofolate dehydrogenase/5,10-methenyltetrahydrofolate cyclohydrolase [Patescibacteria group bacterium]|nr:bifunctional 5,10-methylenetetrahydrofolate dehydrogenase/5,10-methenyltetrahydrofolate cyclohydrolase [Patescibacteria group bacterium]MBU4367430.1 bifunctional 5,10-methylenetetrahydrofolate dehydrogenase/5,10-methenyltetrahydrofolate cyclohydrolase [Patescibacteria group bacterium]MBU4461750.1 bifunctional 5,10-methylenetetrahydrofolate dehydrogenase/5,10-methenyltetrahydrofolate cyclohydrolase [Patescibacteria group bacterium]MCG2700134.1 bifunctional 5,10-methylenetetrahydrofolate dehydr
MKLLNGKKIAQEILGNLKKEIKKKNLKLKLVVVLVGDDQVSKIFVKQKEIACRKVGIKFSLLKLPNKTSFPILKKEIERTNKNPDVSGAIVQLPLPKHLREKDQEILNIILQDKDVDILSEKNLGKFYTGNLSVLPPVVGAILHLLNSYKISVKSKDILLVGAGRLVGFPLAIWLLKQKATVSIINEFTEDAYNFLKKSDIIISGVGKPNLINGSMVKKGVIIIDAGTSLKQGKLIGDVDFKSVAKKAKFITPVPGGVGPLTVACLLENLVKLNQNAK